MYVHTYVYMSFVLSLTLNMTTRRTDPFRLWTSRPVVPPSSVYPRLEQLGVRLTEGVLFEANPE